MHIGPSGTMNELTVHCFPSNYIDSDGFINRRNSVDITVEDLTAGFVAIIAEENQSLELSAKLAESEPVESFTKKEPLKMEFSEGQSESVSVTEEKSTEIPSVNNIAEVVDAHDFSYPQDWEPTTGDFAKRGFTNLHAVEVLKRLEKENRAATAKEQNILSHYIGWGGLADWFREDEDAPKEGKYNRILKEQLTESEYKAARATVNDAFYTPKPVLDAIYKALRQFGFTGGNILEPSMGIGNFYSAMPEDMKENSRLFGVEIDSISGRIASLLHPNCNIQISGIENAQLPHNFFDCVIGNVPFGEYKVNDRKFNKENFLIHDYFFAKALDLCAPGGIVCFITSKGTLDKKNSHLRKYVSEKADFIGAIRLPNNTFTDSANTEVTSDILFLQKRERTIAVEPDWIHLGFTSDGIPVNSYFAEHPEMMLGSMRYEKGRFGDSLARIEPLHILKLI